MSLKQRIEKLESGSGMGEQVFILGDDKRAGIRQRNLLRAMSEALTGQRTRGARVLLQAKRARGGGNLHSLVQALASGPAEYPIEEE